jgi:hypothetical protein
MRLRPSKLRNTICDLRIASRDRVATGGPSPHSGVALVVTIVLLSVITFLAIVFLALTGRETGASKNSVNQTTARFATDTGVEHAKAALLAGILSSRSVANFGLLTSTNYYNYNGYDPAAVELLTNVNYEYRVGGGALSQAQFLQNVSNLYYGARAPVYVTNRAFPNSNEFRYYLDLNRNGRHDLSGLWPVRSETGFYDTNGLPIPFIIPGNTLSNYVKGDPEWRGILDRPNQPHGPENQFLSRYAYMVVPIGKTLDVNYGFNNAKPNNLPYYYLRNQGVGSWEINHAAFFADLNTNYWNSFAFTPYDYQTNQNAPSIGTAFEDAYTLWRWRVGIGQRSVQTLFGPAGVNAFQTDFADGYSAGPVLADPRGYSINDPDNAPINRTGSAWPGDDMQNHFFSSQDFFDTAKTAVGVPNGVPTFTDRLTWAGTSNSTYNAYTFYRMFDQLGMDSAPEDSDKLNLNYVNVGGLSATNFVLWNDSTRIQAQFGLPLDQTAKLFFTNVADRLLRAYTSEWLARDIQVAVGNTNISAYLDTFQTEKPFGVTDIPVMVSNKFVYNSALHRVLQVSANLWETKNGTNAFPTVFRPVFYLTNNNLYIRDFVVEESQADILADIGPRPIVDVTASTNLATVVGAYNTDGNYLVYGVPLVIGAHKGLPNFNEFQIAPSFQFTRKVQLVKPTATSTVISQTNQIFTLALTMPTAAEFWNPYMTNYTRPVTVYVTNRTTLTLTNDLGVNYTTTFIVGDQWTSNSWPKFNSLSPLATQNKYSFVALMRTNIPFLPQVGTNIGYIPNLGFVSATNSSLFDTSQNLYMPHWGMTITNRVHAMILEQGTDRIIDYVLLGNLTCHTNLTDVFAKPTSWLDDFFGGGASSIEMGFESVWATNAAANPNFLSGRPGIIQQIAISRGDYGTSFNSYWKSYGKLSPEFSSVASAITFFQRFLSANATTNIAVVPFSPTVQFSLPRIWQANDPLVHYQADDMFYADQAEAEPIRWTMPPRTANYTPFDNVGKLNDRYQPWGGNPVKGPDNALNSRSPAIKDPGATSADMWEFPTNALPSVGWMGRVHRGTPWQSIYQKAADVNLASEVYSMGDWLADGNDARSSIRWRNATGNRNLVQGYYSRPSMDRMLFDEFTTVLTDNAARGRLPINQTGLAAWSAVFSGVAVLVNTNPVAKQYGATIIQPAGVFDFTDTNSWPPLVKLWNGINRQRALTNAAGPIFPGAAFQTLGDILSVPELTDASPFLNTNTLANTISDAAYEWLPQQVLGLLQLGEPRFVIYSYGQSLQPAPDSIIAGGPFSGLCTNYAITAEVASRAVVKMVGSANPSRTNSFLPPEKRYPPRLVTESYNLLGPD